MNEEIVLIFEKWILKYFENQVNLDRYDFGFKGYKDQQTHDMYHAFLNGRNSL